MGSSTARKLKGGGMHRLEITYAPRSGTIEVAWQSADAVRARRRYPEQLAFTDPLGAEQRSELRWYLEDYLQFPYGAERWRAEQVEKHMATWGEALFGQVFPRAEAEPDPRMLYQEAVRNGLEQCQLCISSENTAFLNIPWELIRDPTPGRGYLAPSLGGLFRQRTGQKIDEAATRRPTGSFRVLLVIARPYGARDIPHGTVARPVLEALRPLRPQLELEVLRPPTFDALQRVLNEHRGQFDLVHFDGHGVFAEGVPAPGQFGVRANSGHLVFETSAGEPQIVSSRELGDVLASCKVPLFVLNACQSAQEGADDPFSSVAAQLVAIGATGVVAMAYSVYASTAAGFMARFYERLAAHAPLPEAVADARRGLYANPLRPSVAGPLELRDWIVPTLYQQTYSWVPFPGGTHAVPAEPGPELVIRRQAEAVCPEGTYGFIGRDYAVLRIERALRRDDRPWVLLSGIGGTGKTELAYGFGRWYAETGGCPGGVFATSFTKKADWGQVVGSLVGYGADFSRLPEEEQFQRLVEYLRGTACLLIWDNLEPVAGYPEGAVPLASDAERTQLGRFLRSLRGGKSRVLLTSRKADERWLGVAYELLELSGLTEQDAVQLAETVLATVGRRPEDYRDEPAYAALIKLLRGHPRSLEVVLPQLRTRSPDEIIAALQERVERWGEELEDASLTYAFGQLSERVKRHLPLLGLFTTTADVDVLAWFVAAGGQQQEIYAEIVGEALEKESWAAVLEEAARNGLLRAWGQGVYELHPTLPPFLRRQLQVNVGDDGLTRLDQEFVQFYAHLAKQVSERAHAGDLGVLDLISREEGNLLRAVRRGVQTALWVEVTWMVVTLWTGYEARGRDAEWRALRREVLARIGRESPVRADTGQANLWMFLLGEEANEALHGGDYAQAETDHRLILTYLEAQNPKNEPMIGVAYHQLGIVAEERNQRDQAEQRYRKALEIRERLKLEREAAADYHQLGNIAYFRPQLDQAEQWYRKALEIRERLKLEREAATDYHQLGMVAQLRNQLDQAEQWLHKALEIFERLKLEREAAKNYHQLGSVALMRNQLDQAEQWYRKALEIREQLKLEREAATDYHQLGMVAQERNQLDQAEQWYRKALEIFERLKLEREAAADYHQLGMVAQERNQLDQAEQWYRKALEIREQLKLEREAATNYHQLGIVAQERNQLDQAEQWYRKALEVFERLKLEREAAEDYHELGIVAQKRNQRDQAEQWYCKALEVFERLGHPPLKVNTLAQFGLLSELREEFPAAIVSFVAALEIAIQYQLPVGRKVLRVLHLLRGRMGAEAFAATWRSVVDNQEDLLRVIEKSDDQA